MKRLSTEVECKTCKGTGFPHITQPSQPERKIYPAPCQECGGKGRISNHLTVDD
jgi:DnaJ-class molecular chaperone